MNNDTSWLGNISAQLAVYLHSANLIMIDMTVSIKKRNFKCTTCKKEFLTKREIERHNRREQNELKFECYICRSTFEEKNQLRDHLGIHTGEKRHNGDMCNKKLRCRSALKSSQKCCTYRKNIQVWSVWQTIEVKGLTHKIQSDTHRYESKVCSVQQIF